MTRRAETPDQKREIVMRLLVAWQSCPQLRLGQLIENAMSPGGNIFYVEDEQLAEQVEVYAYPRRRG